MILEAEAEAEALRVRGEAEAFAVEAKARAEAEQMAKKADAWKDYKEAAMVDMLLDTLPKVQCWPWEEKINTVYLMRWMEGRIRKKLGMLTVNMRMWAVDGNCEHAEAEIDDKNDEQGEMGED